MSRSAPAEHAGAPALPLAPPVRAVLFDMDGVVTDTADAHAAAWKRLFDGFLEAHARANDERFVAFDLEADYARHVDGKRREDGVRDFLASRGVTLPDGGPDDAQDAATVSALARRKNEHFRAWLAQHPARAFPGTLACIDALRRAGVRVAVFSASRNAEAVLRSAGVLELFDARVDGNDAARLHLPGKPDPSLLLEAAARLGVPAPLCAVVEDALAGVQAGAAGGFAQVIGVDRHGHAGVGDGSAAALREAGAHLVVHDLAELAQRAADPADNGAGVRLSAKTLDVLPSARGDGQALAAALAQRLAGRRPVVFLDYDGTLTPIVEDHTRAFLSEPMREALRRLATRCAVAVVSGRDLAMLRKLVDLDAVWYAGSHGFEIAPPQAAANAGGAAAGGDTGGSSATDEGGSAARMERGTEFLPELARAERQLRERLAGIDGHSVERKRFSIAVHFRQVAEADLARLQAQVRSVLDECARLKLGHGKKVFELQPAIDWHKGQAVRWLLERIGGPAQDALPIYVGDDITDENAFRALAGLGVSIVVRDGSRRGTAADLALDGVDEVRLLLDALASHAAKRTAPDSH